MHDHDSPSPFVRHTLTRIRQLAHPRIRSQQRCYWIEGQRQFIWAVEAGIELDTIVESPILIKGGVVRRLVREQIARGIRRVRVTPEQFRAITCAERASGIGAIARQRWTPLAAADACRGLAWPG